MSSWRSSCAISPCTVHREAMTSSSDMSGQSTSVVQRCANSAADRSGRGASASAMSSGRSCGTNSTIFWLRPVSLQRRYVSTKSTTLSWLVTKPNCIVINSQASSKVVRGSSARTAASASPAAALAKEADWTRFALSLRDVLPRTWAWILEAALSVVLFSISNSFLANFPRCKAWILAAAWCIRASSLKCPSVEGRASAEGSAATPCEFSLPSLLAANLPSAFTLCCLRAILPRCAAWILVAAAIIARSFSPSTSVDAADASGVSSAEGGPVGTSASESSPLSLLAAGFRAGLVPYRLRAILPRCRAWILAAAAAMARSLSSRSSSSEDCFAASREAPWMPEMTRRGAAGTERGTAGGAMALAAGRACELVARCFERPKPSAAWLADARSWATTLSEQSNRSLCKLSPGLAWPEVRYTAEATRSAEASMSLLGLEGALFGQVSSASATAWATCSSASASAATARGFSTERPDALRSFRLLGHRSPPPSPLSCLAS
mmetsp:Transcript_27006/g.80467  ORF Transcript_27006/g.80467 Transcript_27006/m.80467 type:complete len:495 (+) Transcript_27006:805-2289(+)